MGLGGEQLLELGVLAHRVAVPADVDDVAVVDQAVDERAGHDVVAEDLAPVLEALVGGEDGGGVLVAPAHELEEEDAAGAGDREIADLVDHEEPREEEGLEPLAEASCALGLLEGGDEVGEGAVVDAAAALGGGDGEANGHVGLSHPGTAQEDDVLPALVELEAG